MSKSVKYILLILLTGLSISIVADLFLQRGFEKSDDDVIGKLNEITRDSTYYDILCFGSSRGLAHFNPQIIEKETGLKAYNAGLNGGCFIDFSALFKAYLHKHPSPKMLIVHIDEFSFDTQTISELPRYMPFISNDILYDNLVKYDKTFLAVKYLRFLRLMYYNDLLKWISLKSWFSIDARDEYKMVNGYRANTSQWTGYFDERLQEWLKQIRSASPTDLRDKEGEQLFRDMLVLCQNYNIQIILTSSPIIGGNDFERYDHTCEKIELIAANYTKSFLWMHHEQWSSQEYFYDFTHMNSKGADRYSHALAAFINKQK